MRTPADELHADAVEVLLEALLVAGLQASRTADADLVRVGPTRPVLIDVDAASVLDAARAQASLSAHRRRRGPDSMVVLVADQLSEDARDVLRSSEWGYLDRRGALWLRRPELMVNDTTLPPLGRHRARPDRPIRGRVAVGVALSRLMHEKQESVREIAGRLEASPSTVHDALASLREASLVDVSGAPSIPEPFEATAAVWRPERVPVRREPGPGDVDVELGLRPEEVREQSAPGWVVAGDVRGSSCRPARRRTSTCPPARW